MNMPSAKKTYIDRAIRKYGRENFKSEVLKNCYSKVELDAWEKFFIVALHCKTPIGYNCTDGGEGIVGLKRTAEHNKKIGMANKGKKRTPEQCANISSSKKGKPLSSKHKVSIGTTLKGVSKTYEHCINISKGKRGKSLFKNLITEIDNRQLTYAELAQLLGLAPQNISRKMLGQRNFTEKDKFNLVRIFNKPIEYLMVRRNFYEGSRIRV